MKMESNRPEIREVSFRRAFNLGNYETMTAELVDRDTVRYQKSKED